MVAKWNVGVPRIGVYAWCEGRRDSDGRSVGGHGGFQEREAHVAGKEAVGGCSPPVK